MSEPANPYLAEGDDERERLRIQASLQGDRDLNVIAAATRELPGPLAGIDLGCDNGHLTRLRFAAECFECVLGLDRPEPAIAAAAVQTTDPRFHFEVAELEPGDLAQRLEGFAAGQPTVVFASFVTHLLDCTPAGFPCCSSAPVSGTCASATTRMPPATSMTQAGAIWLERTSAFASSPGSGATPRSAASSPSSCRRPSSSSPAAKAFWPSPTPC